MPARLSFTVCSSVLFSLSCKIADLCYHDFLFDRARMTGCQVQGRMMKDFLFLFYLVVTGLSLVGLTLGVLICLKKSSRTLLVSTAALAILTAMEINGIADFYSRIISKGFSSITFSWNFFVYYFLQVTLCAYLVNAFIRGFFPEKGKKGLEKILTFGYLALSALMLVFYLLINRVLPLFASHNDFIYRLVYFSGLNIDLARILSFWVTGSTLLTDLFLAVGLLVLLRRGKEEKYRRLMIGLSLLILFYLPLWLYSQYCVPEWLHPLNPVSAGTLFLLGCGVIYLRLVFLNIGGLFQENRLPVSLSEPFVEAYRLSKREKDTAELLIQGKAYKEMADVLHVSLSTVKTHLQSVYEKTGTRTRMEFLQCLSAFRSDKAS